jgi:hypothetical protein
LPGVHTETYRPELMMGVTASAREHLFETISQQYESEDAETLKALLMTVSTEDLVTKQDLAAFKTEFRAEFKAEFAEFKAEMHQALYQQTRTYVSWMFGLLTVYTAMAGSFVAFAALIIR